ncbi:unnamed protein product, partial [Brenthis ino]
MDGLEHEDLLIKLRAKLNEEKIRLWEVPYVLENGGLSDSLKDLSVKYATALNLDANIVLQGLHELQLHSIERAKANEEFKETGCATLRVKATVPGEKPQVMKFVKQLNVMGGELASSVAELLNVSSTRVKLIYNGKLINQSKSLEEQGLKNGVQLMALVMEESPELIKKEDNMYMEMKSTMEDATLLTEYVDDFDESDDYIKLEDQSGKTVELPVAERRALLVGLALHERGRAAAKNHDYSLALVLLLEADRQLSECRSSILSSVDNCAILQLDISWCYLCLQSLSSASDASARLARAEKAFIASYGEDHQRLIALKGTNANERVLFMRLYLLQGIVAYHQNKRAEAKMLLDKAEAELNCLRVDESSVAALMELGWSAAAARCGLRAARGQRDGAHLHLEARRRARDLARRRHDEERVQYIGPLSPSRSLPLTLTVLAAAQRGGAAGTAAHGVPGGRGAARAAALRPARGRRRAPAARPPRPALLCSVAPTISCAGSESDDNDAETSSSEESVVEPDNRLVAELEAMGYPAGEARAALLRARNNITKAVDLLLDNCTEPCDSANPSTSAAAARKKQKMENKEKKKKERDMALRRLKKAIHSEDDDYLSASLAEEEQFLVQYKSLL